MYYPYFRGKQFELITIREMAEKLSQSGFVPIIEPVKEALSGLHRALKAICDANGKVIVVVNPDYGDHADDGANISDFLSEDFKDVDSVSVGILLKATMTVEDAVGFYGEHEAHNPVFIHAGFKKPKELSERLAALEGDKTHVFLENYGGKLYRRHFKDSRRVLLSDGFKRRRNADYPEEEEFSELHVTYEDEGMDGFGDFLIVGDEYSEGGGPAYAVAIHLTYIDPYRENVMYIYHFISTTNDTPTNPAGKFEQALGKLIEKLDSGDSKLFEGKAIEEFRALHAKGHFPGLGYVKKLSMKHHIETLANFLD